MPQFLPAIYKGISLLGLLLILWTPEALSQFGNGQNPAYNQPGGNSEFGSTGGAYNNGNFNQGLNPGEFGTDSLGEVNGPLKIKPDTRYLSREQLFTHQSFDTRATAAFANSYYWDILDAAEGFTQSLGQTGKSYKVYHHGIDEQFFERNFWKDPIQGRYNRYMIDPERQALYYDTKTPYVNVNYAQGSQKLQLVNIGISQNITPLWNMALQFHRRQSEGIYRNFVTDHTQIYLSGNYHTKNKRYYVFGNLFFNQLRDEMNGGVPRVFDEAVYPVVDGLIQDVGSLYNQSFFKSLSSPMLSGALLEKNTRGLYVDQYYHLLRKNDTTNSPHQLTLRNALLVENGGRRFVDESISQSALDNNMIPVYPSKATDSTDIYEGYNYNRLKIAGEASYTLELARGWKLNLNGGVNYQQNGLTKDTLIVRQTVTEQIVKGTLTIPGFVAKANIQQRFSNTFSAQRKVAIEGALFPLGKRPVPFKVRASNAKDSTGRKPVWTMVSEDSITRNEDLAPLRLSLNYDLGDINPSLFQTYFTGDSGNAYLPNPNLTNQLVNHISVGATYRFPTIIKGPDTLLPMYAALNGFITRGNKWIYYDNELNPLQSGEGESLTRIGIEAKFRLRFLKKFYWESRATLQNSSAVGDETFQLYAKNIPQVYGKTSLYYDDSRVRFAERVRLGVDVYFNNSYAGQTVDPISGEFFPTNYEVPGYARIDAFLAMRIKGVHLFLKFVHVNERVLLAGYYTTPFYPMLERTFTLGVNWTFFD